MAKLSYPIMGHYGVAIHYLFSNILEDEIIKPPKISIKTMELGSMHSPDFVCSPFKYTLGTMIESLNLGADTLIQMGGGCRYGYYHELQAKILEDLGYKFKLVNLISGGKGIKLKSLLNDYDLHIKKMRFPYYYLITKRMIKYIDEIEDYIRRNKCLEAENKYDELFSSMLDSFSECRGYFHLNKMYKDYKQKFISVSHKNKRPFKVALIGELYTLMEPNANYHIEDMLSQRGVSITRPTNVTYLLFDKKKVVRDYIKEGLVKYRMGADALDNINHTKHYCESEYDGIIHIKSTFCTPEIAALPIIENICLEYDVPVLFLSMDMNTSASGIETRIDAFCDILEMRNEI